VGFESIGVVGMLLDSEAVAGFDFLLCLLFLGDIVNCEGVWLSKTSGSVRNEL
jgi:hypothetical protein